MSTPYFLLTESTFHAAYLVTDWLVEHGGNEAFRGIVQRADAPARQLRNERAEFHWRHQGARDLDDRAWARLERLYPHISTTERAMIAEFGVPASAVDAHEDTVYLGSRLNGDTARSWLTAQCSGAEKPYLFVFLDKLLAPWWITATESRIINVHSAVLPHARGTFAIEQAAVLGDGELFAAAAGATAHFVDDGVDTGAIIKAMRFSDPFAFESIWSCKGNSFMLAFTLLDRVARDIRDGGPAVDAGIVPARSPFGAPEFKRRDFTPQVQAESEAAYLVMRERRRRGVPNEALHCRQGDTDTLETRRLPSSTIH